MKPRSITEEVCHCENLERRWYKGRDGYFHCEQCDGRRPRGLVALEAENERLRSALEELVDAGEPFIGDAFRAGKLNGYWLRIFNRWQAAMNDARKASSSSGESES